MRSAMSLCVGFATLLALAACTSPEINRLPSMRSGLAVPVAQYRPAADAILVINGGFGTAKSAGPLVTQWRRKTTGETFFLTLDPNIAEVQALVPGTYELVDATGIKQQVIGKGEHEFPASRLGTITLNAGDVVYAGRLLVTPQNLGKKPADSLKPYWTVEIGNDSNIAAAGIQRSYPGQAGRMRVDLLKLTRG